MCKDFKHNEVGMFELKNAQSTPSTVTFLPYWMERNADREEETGQSRIHSPKYFLSLQLF